MLDLTIKGVPDSLYRRLKRLAALHRRSLNNEIIICLEQASGAANLNPEAWLGDADRMRKRLALSSLTERMLRKAKEVGRP